jgi:hypothetical protein
MSAQKTHAWFAYALKAFPVAHWIGKTEDDAMVRVRALWAELKAVRAVRQDVESYGTLYWIGTCELVERQRCNNVWCGRVQPLRGRAQIGPPDCNSPPFDMARAQANEKPTAWLCVPNVHDNWRDCHRRFRIDPGSAECPSFLITPFVSGPLEIRARSLVERITRCLYARRFFETMSRRSALMVTEGGDGMCGMTDGTQGHALGACSANRSSVFAVLDDGRNCWPNMLLNNPLSWARRHRCNASSIVVHPLKGANRSQWAALWDALANAVAGEPTASAHAVTALSEAVQVPLVTVHWATARRSDPVHWPKVRTSDLLTCTATGGAEDSADCARSTS